MGVPSPYVTKFLQRVRKRAEEMRSDHIFSAYLQKSTWEETQSLRYPVSLSSLERRSLVCPMAMCCKQIDHICVHTCEEDISTFLLSVAHVVCADFLYVRFSCHIRNLVVMQCDKHLVCMRLTTVKIFLTDLKLC
jgi:hypothetical protein